MADRDTAIEVSGLWKRLGGRAVLRDVNCSLQLGEMVAVVGANGAGKTTLLKMSRIAAASVRGTHPLVGSGAIRNGSCVAGWVMPDTTRFSIRI